MIHLLLLARSRGIALIVAEHRPEINAVGFDEIITMPYGTRDSNGQVASFPVASCEPKLISAAKHLALDRVEAGYPQSRVYCEHLELSYGGAAIISGENGSGKTGFLKALAGIPPATLDGDVHLGDKKIASLAEAMQETQVRYMAQDRDNFLELSASDAMLAASGGNDKFDGMLQQVLASVGKRKRVGTLSSGSRALLSLAQTLACRPRLALLDEPFANVDRANRQRMQSIVSHAREEFGTAFLIVEHGDVDLPGATHYTIRQNGKGAHLEPGQ